MRIETIKQDFVAVVRDADVGGPLSDADIAQLRDWLDRYVVLHFPDQTLSDAHQVAFSARFGPPEKSWRTLRAGMGGLVKDQAISMIGNVDERGDVIASSDLRRINQRGNMLWHSDSSYRVPSGLYTMLFGRHVPPEGGATQFADMRAAYDALPAERRAFLEGLRVEHCLDSTFARADTPPLSPDERTKLPPVIQPLVRTHPVTGRKSLYLGSPAMRVLGMGEAEGQALLEELTGFATADRFVYEHRWAERDLVMWDNRSSMHRGRPFAEASFKRQLRRTTVCDMQHAAEALT